jgi:hypothetical protein
MSSASVVVSAGRAAEARTGRRWTPRRVLRLLLGALCCYLAGISLTAALVDGPSLGLLVGLPLGVLAAGLLGTGVRLVTGTLRR